MIVIVNVERFHNYFLRFGKIHPNVLNVNILLGKIMIVEIFERVSEVHILII